MATSLPSNKELFELHRKHAKTADLLITIWSHCQIVADIAEQIIEAKGLKIDKDLVRVGALLHDIGVYELPRENDKTKPGEYIKHGVLGEQLLKNESFSEQICRFASHHTGVGITKNEVIKAKLNLPPADYTAQTTEERLVMYADKFHSKFPLRFETFEAAEKEIAAYGGDNLSRLESLTKEFGKPDVSSLAKRHSQPVVN